MDIRQFEDKYLSHYSYAILSDRRVALVDPGRDPSPYYEFAKQNNAIFSAVFETHPHADFISSHAEIHRMTGAPIFASKLLKAKYSFLPFDDGDRFRMGQVEFRAINTPGHSPDSICILAEENGKAGAVFTGDTLFIGDCGRPDLREEAGAITESREKLAQQMYHSLREKLAVLPDDTKVFPSHGAGSLCGRGMSTANESTIGAEKVSNWSMQEYTEDGFVKELLSDQPFVPKYFVHSVNLNREGAPDFDISIANVAIGAGLPDEFSENTMIIDVRDKEVFQKGSIKGSINIMESGKMETWLGSVVNPGEQFYIITSSDKQAQNVIRRIAKIGYEEQIKKVFVVGSIPDPVVCQPLDVAFFGAHQDDYTIIDVRNDSEVRDGKIFADALAIPLSELRERISEIPTNKSIVVHCAGGYRSGIGMCIIKNKLNGSAAVFDLGSSVALFSK